jgi:hypothetical protein
MIGYIFIQTDKMTLEGLEEFIRTYEIVFAINVRFRHSSFGIKGGTIHLLLLFFFNYCYAIEIRIDFLLV